MRAALGEIPSIAAAARLPPLIPDPRGSRLLGRMRAGPSPPALVRGYAFSFGSVEMVSRRFICRRALARLSAAFTELEMFDFV